MLEIVTSYAHGLARILIGFYFFFFCFWNFYYRKAALQVMRDMHIPLPDLVLYFGVLSQAVAGGLIILNQYTSYAALYLMLFTLIATFIFHRFWTMKSDERRLNTIIFIGNLTVTLAGLFLIF